MKKFYDIHMHAFDLSHPNLSAFFQREDIVDVWLKSEKKEESECKFNFCKIIGLIVLLPVILLLLALFIAASPFILLVLIVITIMAYKKWISPYKTLKDAFMSIIKTLLKIALKTSIAQKIIRTITFFEIPMEYQFLVLEHYLEKESGVKDNQIQIGENIYDKIVLCPLVIDFGYKNMHNASVYKLTPKTPTAKQVGDLLYAIRTYYRFRIKLDDKDKNKMSLERIDGWENCKQNKMFEIYPFMGLNTKNYDLKKLEELLDKYFKNFNKDNNNDTADERRNKLFEAMGMFDSNIYRDKLNLTEEEKENATVELNKKHISFDYQYAFAGIKIYPQLGFDPYPNETKELEKVKYLYKYCIDKRIPITTHCSDGGYKTGDNDNLTSPLTKWKKVLEYEDETGKKPFEKLTLNFAHFGHQKRKRKWRDEIIRLAEKYPNVYTDISCNDMSEKYYKDLKDDLKKNPHLQNKVLFGSDFSINLLVTETESYDNNLSKFAEAKLEYQDLLCNHNSERFLFGGKIEE